MQSYFSLLSKLAVLIFVILSPASDCAYANSSKINSGTIVTIQDRWKDSYLTVSKETLRTYGSDVFESTFSQWKVISAKDGNEFIWLQNLATEKYLQASSQNDWKEVSLLDARDDRWSAQWRFAKQDNGYTELINRWTNGRLTSNSDERFSTASHREEYWSMDFTVNESAQESSNDGGIDQVILANDRSYINLAPGTTRSRSFEVFVGDKQVPLEQGVRVQHGAVALDLPNNKKGAKLEVIVGINAPSARSYRVSPPPPGGVRWLDDTRMAFSVDGSSHYIIARAQDFSSRFENYKHEKLVLAVEDSIDNGTPAVDRWLWVDSDNYSTESVQEQVNESAVSGGDKVVYFPPGRHFELGSIELKSNSSIFIGHSTRITALPMPLGPQRALFWGINASNISIAGRGSIDIGGDSYVFAEGLLPREQLDQRRHHAFYFWGADGLRMKDITILNPGTWATLIAGSRDVRIDNLKSIDYLNPDFGDPIEKNEGHDGIVIDRSFDVQVTNSLFYSGDDSLTIKHFAKTRQFFVEDDPEDSSAEMVFDNIVTYNYNTGRGIALSDEFAPGVTIRDIAFRNITVVHAPYGIMIDTKNERDTAERVFQDITFENIQFESVPFQAINLNSNKNQLSNLRFDQLSFEIKPQAISELYGDDGNNIRDSLRFTGLKVAGESIQNEQQLEQYFVSDGAQLTIKSQ